MPKVKQPSRKGKSAWRKNIDIAAIEAKLENDRAAERAGMAPVDAKTASSSIFIEDRAGNEEVARAQRKSMANVRKPLKSLAILRSKDSGFAPVLGRARKGQNTISAMKAEGATGGLTPEQRARLNGMTKKDMNRLRRVAGRDVRGAFGVIEEEERDGSSTARGPQAVVSETYDVWNGVITGNGDTKVRAPVTASQLRSKNVSLPLPDQGQSYNPSAEAHEALLAAALNHAKTQDEASKIEAEFLQKWKAGGARRQQITGDKLEDILHSILGMKVEQLESDDDDGDDDGNDSDEEELNADGIDPGLSAAKKMAKRKTKQQRAKAKRLKEEIRARQAIKSEKRTREQLHQLRRLKRQLTDLDEEIIERSKQRKEARERRLDEKVGMYKIAKREKEVQLGEDLAESLRGLKPEGNLLRDRIEAFQRRGLVIPKHAVYGRNRRSTRQTARTKEYETHSYKRFS